MAILGGRLPGLSSGFFVFSRFSRVFPNFFAVALGGPTSAMRSTPTRGHVCELAGFLIACCVLLPLFDVTLSFILNILASVVHAVIFPSCPPQRSGAPTARGQGATPVPNPAERKTETDGRTDGRTDGLADRQTHTHNLYIYIYIYR